MVKRVAICSLELLMGLLFWGLFIVYVYVAYTKLSALTGPRLGPLGSGLWVLAMVIVPCLFGCQLIKFSVRGIGKVHYAFGSRGWSLRFLLVLFLVIMPMIMIPVFTLLEEFSWDPMQLLLLLSAWITGRGLRRSLSHELEIIQVS